MFDKQAIEALQETNSIVTATSATSAALGSHPSGMDTDGVLSLPAHYTVHDLEKFMPTRRRARGLMVTDVLESFAAYTLEHAEDGATVFVNTDDMSATAVLNLGAPDTTLHADNKANLCSRQTAAYKALRTVANGQGQKQATEAETLRPKANAGFLQAVKTFKQPDAASRPPNTHV